MRKVVMMLIAAGALAAVGCEEKKADKPATSAPTAKATGAATAAPAKTGAGW